MSWSVTFIGRPAKIQAALDKESARLTGSSKTEFDSVLDGLKSIVGATSEEKVVRLDASGSAYDGRSTCTVNCTPLGSILD
jgi:hypothetical protein